MVFPRLALNLTSNADLENQNVNGRDEPGHDVCL